MPGEGEGAVADAGEGCGLSGLDRPSNHWLARVWLGRAEHRRHIIRPPVTLRVKDLTNMVPLCVLADWIAQGAVELDAAESIVLQYPLMHSDGPDARVEEVHFTIGARNEDTREQGER